tara:strand:- start:95 stop:631 length:537 start_codon:yes stop_codon:yes gene_type:complete
MNKEIYHQIYQSQLKLARELNHDLTILWNMDQYTIQLNRLYSFQDIESNLKTIDLNQYTTFPFDTDKYSSYILYHSSFRHSLSLLSVGLSDDQELQHIQKKSGLIGEFCCYKLSEMISKFYHSENRSVTTSNAPTSINIDQLAEFSSELLVSNFSLLYNNSSRGNFYIIFPYSLGADS